MPDANGALTAAEKQKAIDWLNLKAPSIRCPSCGNRQFSILDHLVVPNVFFQGGITIGGPSYPLFGLACGVCGHILFYSAVASGVLPQAAKPAVAAPEAKK